MKKATIYLTDGLTITFHDVKSLKVKDDGTIVIRLESDEIHAYPPQRWITYEEY